MLPVSGAEQLHASEAIGERPRISASGRVVGVGEPGAVLGVGQEHVPQPRLARAHLELLHDRRAGGGGCPDSRSCALVDRLGGVDVLVHERAQALLEFGAALAGLEVHRSSSVTAMGLGSSRMSEQGASYRAAGVDYDALDAGKRLAMAEGAVDLAAAGGARRARARRLARRAGVRVRARRADVRVRRRGARHEVDHRAPRARAAGRSTASPTSPTTRSRRSSTTSCCVGALPLVVNAYFATGASEWYLQRERSAALLEGWRSACADAGCVWGGGESPSLPGLLDERDIELAGAAVGAVPRGPRADPRRGAARRAMRSCSWPRAGCTPTARRSRGWWPGRLHDGYATRLPDGSTFGEALLAPSVMYVPLVAALLERRGAADATSATSPATAC